VRIPGAAPGRLPEPPGALPSPSGHTTLWTSIESEMLIATLGPSTAWQGQKITWDEGRFLLEGYGPIGAEDVMEYDRQGHLAWESEGRRRSSKSR
jgi:hypothetical protein